jgi:hypothetical protein
MIFRLWILTIFISPMSTNAQTYDADAHQKGFSTLTQSGKMLNLVITPKSNSVRLDVVGREAAGLHLDDGAVFVSYGADKNKRQINVVRLKDSKTGKEYYEFDRPSTPLLNLQIDVKSKAAKEKFIVPHLK